MKKILLFAFTGIFLSFSALAYAAQLLTVDVDDPYVECTSDIYDHPNNNPTDQIAISNGEGDGCMVENVKNFKVDVAVQYIKHPDFGIAKGILIEKNGRKKFVDVDQSTGSGQIVTSNYIELEPGEKIVVVDQGLGPINIDNFLAKRHQ